MSPAPRIDTLRNHLSSTKDLIDTATAVLETLHELAYNRQTAGERERVSESAPEGYYLDTHGDLRARAAYAALARHLDAACSQISGAARDAVQRVSGVDESGEDRRAPVSIEVVEHLHALDAQSRRQARGEFDAGRTVAQPTRAGTDRTAARKIRSLEADIARRDRKDQRTIRRLEAQVRRKDQALELRDRQITQLKADLRELRRGDSDGVGGQQPATETA